MAIQNYAIIDHIGSLTSEENLKMYTKIYAKAETEGFEKKKTCVTLKTVCLADSPFARQVTDKMKYRARRIKNPRKVYFICNKLNSKSEAEARKWCKRNIEVELYDVKNNETYIYDKRMMSASPYSEWEPTEIKFNENEITLMRLIAYIYAPAMNYPFSAPIFRIDDVLVPENYIKRSDHDAMVASGETHFTKPYTSATKFIQYNRAVATDNEIKAFIEYLNAYLTLTGCKIVTKPGKYFGAITGNIEAFSEYLDIDYIICPHCRRPYLVTNHKDQFGKLHKNSICTFCDGEVEDPRFEAETFFEDTVEDNPYFDEFEDEEYFEDAEYLALEAEYNL